MHIQKTTTLDSHFYINKQLLFIILIFFIQTGFSQNIKTIKKSDLKDPFVRLKYTHVIAYNLALPGYIKAKDEDPISSILYKEGKLDKSIVLPEKKLNKLQINNIIQIVVDTSTYGGTNAACFEPRLAFLFYNENKIVASINVCLECNFLESIPFIPATNYYYYKSDEYIIPRPGFSKSGRSRLKHICNDLDMSFCIKEENSIFDE